MGCYLNRLDAPVFMAVSKPLLIEFGIYHRLESCASCYRHKTRLNPKKINETIIIAGKKSGVTPDETGLYEAR